jgi:hypothetical protein
MAQRKARALSEVDQISDDEFDLHCDQIEQECEWKPFGDAGFPIETELL